MVQLRYSHNKLFFHQPNKINSYWAGFIAADGDISNNNNRLKLELAHLDLNHLYKFKIALNAVNPIKIYKNKSTSCEINIYSVSLLNDLKDIYNVVPNKSLVLQPPKLLYEDDIRHFIRGYFDGDGSIFLRKDRMTYRIVFYGTKQILEWINENLQKYINNINHPSIRSGHGNCYQLSFSNLAIQNIIPWLYTNSDDSIRLSRKYDLCQEAI